MDGGGKERRKEADQRSAQAVGRRDERKRKRIMERRSGEGKRSGERRERTGTGEHSPPRERRTRRSNLEARDGHEQRDRRDREERDGLERRGGQAEKEQQEDERRERHGDGERERGRRAPTGKALGVKIMYTNAQSLISKIDELAATASEKKPDFILLTETWCNNTIDNALLTIPGYGIEIRKDRTDTAQGIGGGLIVYARQGWRLEEEEDTNDFNQHCKFRVKCGGVDIRFVLIYRSPNSPPEATDKLIEIMEKAEKNTFMVGDFNYPKIDWQRGTATGRKPQEFMTATEENMMTQLVEFATHTKGNTLDLVITNSPELVDSLEEEGRLGRSDHVIMEMEIGVENRSEEEDGKEYNDWKKADWNQIRRDIGREDWRRTMEGKTVNEAWELLKKKLEETTEKNVPKRRRRNRNRPPWL